MGLVSGLSLKLALAPSHYIVNNVLFLTLGQGLCVAFSSNCDGQTCHKPSVALSSYV